MADKNGPTIEGGNRRKSVAIAGVDEPLKDFARLAGLSLAGLAMLVGGFLWLNWQIEKSAIESHLAADIEVQAAGFSNAIAGMRRNLSILARSPALRRYAAGSEGDRAAAENVFVIHAEEWPTLTQIRYIDVTGRERIRVDSVDGRVWTTEAGDLQDKSARYYVEEGLRLGPGEVYVSRIDLNVEEGRVEIPWKPTLRLTTPVLDLAGLPAGIVVVNLLGQSLLDALGDDDDSSDGPHRTQLLDESGHWLHGVEPERLWGNVFGHAHSFAGERPEVWREITAADRGSLWAGGDFIVFATVRPSTVLNPAADPGREQRWWKIVSVHAIGAAFLAGLSNSAWIFAILVAVVLWLSWVWNAGRQELLRARRGERETRALARAVLDGADVVVQVKDADGHFRFVNAAFERLLGVSRDALVGKLPEEALPPAVARVTKACFEHMLDNPGAKRCEITMPATDGPRTFMANTFPMRNEEGALLAIGQVGIDVTDLKNTQEELRLASEKAEQASVAKSRFLANMSHEIRTPMNGIVGMIELLRGTRLTADQHRMMNTVQDSARALGGIIDDILDFSKIEAGRMSLEMIAVSVRDIVEGVVETLLPNAAKKGVELLCFVDPAIPEWVQGDPVRLRQILFNLIGNAIKFTGHGGRPGHVVVRAEREGGDDDGRVTVHYQVADNGIGMDEAAQARLFESFSQASTDTTRKFGGTGLGLAISHRLATLMGGGIDVDSREGEGSIFTVNIPHRVDDNAEQPWRADLEGIRVLLVEERPLQQEFLSRYLAHWRVEVNVESRTRRVRPTLAAASAAGRPFDAVILGCHLDTRSQVKLRDAIRVDPAIAATRLVFLLRGRRLSARLAAEDTVVLEGTPISRAAFVRAVAVAVGRASPEVKVEASSPRLDKARVPSVVEAAAAGRLILAAEDNTINQEVLRRQLNALGHAVEMADDGRQALDAWRAGNHALVLTDCHMPEMDGFDLAEAIRRAEREEGSGRRVPIVAITANVLEGEAERCREAGMDDVLAKPVELFRLRMALEKWMPAGSAEDGSAGQPSGGGVEKAGEAPPPVDLDTLRQLIGDDPEVCRRLLADAVAPSWAYIEELEKAIEAGLPDRVRSAAHKLKSSSRAIGAQALAETCMKVELAAKGGRWNDIRDEASNLRGLMEAVEAFVDGMRD